MLVMPPRLTITCRALDHRPSARTESDRPGARSGLLHHRRRCRGYGSRRSQAGPSARRSRRRRRAARSIGPRRLPTRDGKTSGHGIRPGRRPPARGRRSESGQAGTRKRFPELDVQLGNVAGREPFRGPEPGQDRGIVGKLLVVEQLHPGVGLLCRRNATAADPADGNIDRVGTGSRQHSHHGPHGLGRSRRVFPGAGS